MVLASVIVIACVMVLASVVALASVMVLARVINNVSVMVSVCVMVLRMKMRKIFGNVNAALAEK